MPRIHEIDPALDGRWDAFLLKHPEATVFHTRPWLTALQQTYGFSPTAFTTSAPTEDLANAVVFCRVKSWLTGRRLVSMPFSDHCAALVDSEEELASLLSQLKREWNPGGQKYLELRSACRTAFPAAGWSESTGFCLHRLSLRPTESELLQALHPTCVRRKIAKAQQQGLIYEEGRSDELLHKFYKLALLTRRRHEIPPQPITWFRNLIGCFGERLKIRMVSHEGQPAAAILTLEFKATMMYKYGCSDTRFLKLGPMQLLLWKAILEAKTAGLAEFDMGRSEWDNTGLIAFKDRWGGTRSALTYYRFPPAPPQCKSTGIAARIARRVCSAPPDRILTLVGSMMYRHIA